MPLLRDIETVQGKNKTSSKAELSNCSSREHAWRGEPQSWSEVASMRLSSPAQLGGLQLFAGAFGSCGRVVALLPGTARRPATSSPQQGSPHLCIPIDPAQETNRQHPGRGDNFGKSARLRSRPCCFLSTGDTDAKAHGSAASSTSSCHGVSKPFAACTLGEWRA
ncbi:hypothetical protein VTN96DRAFT_6450 [Rasamsonia emersonii]